MTLNTHPPRILRLRKRADFLRVRNCGKTIATRGCIIQYAPSLDDVTCNAVSLGFTATKKIGNAVVRNRAKRRLRAIICDKNLQLKSGYDIVLIARSVTAEQNWENLCNDIRNGLSQAHVLVNQKSDQGTKEGF